MSPLFDSSENDVPLRARGAVQDDTLHAREMVGAQSPEREVTLNTGVVLGLFFALALLCAVFFGFGYSMGRKSVPPPVVTETDTSATADETASNTPKPSPGTPATPHVPDYAGPGAATDGKPATPKPAPAPAASDAAAVSEPAARPRGTDVSSGNQSAAPVVRVPAATSPAAASSAPLAQANGSIYVQVSAVSHQEDANVLLSALRRRGYTVFTRQDPNDTLIHVQLGPFATKKDADAMRQRLSGDGYNAILK